MHLHLHLWQDLIVLCQSLNQNQYTHKSEWLNGVSIAEHLRHTYEFYTCLLKGISSGALNYENRERDRRIETDLEYALQKLKQLKNQLEEINPSGKLLLHSEEAQGQLVATSIERELIYCLDHAIHHQALIKIGLKELNLSQLVHNDFGVAYSTLRYRASV